MTDDERYVRNSWESVHRCDGSYRALPAGAIWINYGSCGQAFENWHAAAEFTRERLEQIRQVEEEIGELEEDVRCYQCLPKDERLVAIYRRILVSRQSILADLKRNMKQG